MSTARKMRRDAERWSKAVAKRHGRKGETPRVDRYDRRLRVRGSKT